MDGSTNYIGNSFVPWDNNHVAVRTRIPLLLCPSDRDTTVENPREKTNYAFSRGDTSWDHNPGWNGNGGRGLRGFFVGGSGNSGVRRFRDVSDGMSNTIAMSEKIKGQPAGRNILEGAVSYNLPQDQYRENPANCLAQLGPAGDYIGEVREWSANRWLDGNPIFTGHTTILGPNQASCLANDNGDSGDGILEPSSHHSGGVHALMCDGAVRFISENIALHTWAVIGDRDSQMPVGEF
jgi:prepilin-type processing-associated H-X9-DG protein